MNALQYVVRMHLHYKKSAKKKVFTNKKTIYTKILKAFNVFKMEKKMKKYILMTQMLSGNRQVNNIDNHF